MEGWGETERIETKGGLERRGEREQRNRRGEKIRDRGVGMGKGREGR